MTTYSIANVRSAIKSLLQSISSVEAVYDYQNPEIQGYPAVIFVMATEDASMLDDASNMRIISFKLWVACEVSQKGLADADALLDGVSADVINTLENKANQGLSGACDWMMPVMGNREQTQSPEGSFLYQELTLKVYIASSIL